MKYYRLKPYFHVISREIFEVVLAGYLILLLIDSISPHFVSSVFNLNILLVVLVFFGVAMILTEVPGTILSASQIKRMIWHKFFYKLSLHNLYTREHSAILKEVRAREIVHKGTTMGWRDWYVYNHEQKVANWLSRNIPNRWIFKHLAITKERNWEAFINAGAEMTIKKDEKRYIILSGLFGGFLVYYKTQNLGLSSILVAGMTTLTITLLSYLVVTDSD